MSSGTPKSKQSPQTHSSTISYRTIPHGLTYKHETRHHSTYRRHSTSPKRVSSKVELRRVPLTCVKDRNQYKKLDMVGAKQDLAEILTMEGVNKENKDDEDDLTILSMPVLMPDEEEDVQSSPVNTHQTRKKRAVVAGEAAGSSSSPKRARSSGSVSRGSITKRLSNMLKSARSNSFHTPVQAENSRKSTPKRTRHRRVIDETKMAANAGVLDPQNSPLANVSQGSVGVVVAEDEIDGETEVLRGLQGKGKISELEDEDDEEADLDESMLRLSPVRFNGGSLSPFSRVDSKAQDVDDSEIEELERKSQQLEKEGAGDEEEAAIYTDEQVEEIKRKIRLEIEAVKEDLGSVEGELSETQSKLRDAEGEKIRLIGNRNQLEAKLQSVSVERDACKSTAAANAHKVELLEVRLQIAELRMDKWKKLYTELLAEARRVKADDEREKEQQQGVVEGLQRSVTVLRGKQSELQSSLEFTSSQLKTLQSEKIDSEAMIDRLKKMGDEEERELNRAERELEAAKNGKIAVDKRLAAVEKEKASVETELKKVKAELVRAKSESVKLRGELSKVRGDLATAKTSSQDQAQLADQLKEAQTKFAKRQETFVEREKAFKKKEREFAEQREEFNKDEAALKKQIASLQSEVGAAKTALASQEKSTEDQLEKLAQDLYLQYSAKHEQKVATLKKGYEMKWMGKIRKFSKENETLKQEISGLKKKLEIESNEKKQLVKLWDEYVNLEGKK